MTMLVQDHQNGTSSVGSDLQSLDYRWDTTSSLWDAQQSSGQRADLPSKRLEVPLSTMVEICFEHYASSAPHGQLSYYEYTDCTLNSKERTDHPLSYVEAKQLKSIHTHGCLLDFLSGLLFYPTFVLCVFIPDAVFVVNDKVRQMYGTM